MFIRGFKACKILVRFCWRSPAVVSFPVGWSSGVLHLNQGHRSAGALVFCASTRDLRSLGIFLLLTGIWGAALSDITRYLMLSALLICPAIWWFPFFLPSSEVIWQSARPVFFLYRQSFLATVSGRLPACSSGCLSFVQFWCSHNLCQFFVIGF